MQWPRTASIRDTMNTFIRQSGRHKHRNTERYREIQHTILGITKHIGLVVELAQQITNSFKQ